MRCHPYFTIFLFRGVHTVFLWGNLREGDHLIDPGVDRRILTWIFEKWDGRASIQSIWLRIERGGRLL
jgi:hypothetical protein